MCSLRVSFSVLALYCLIHEAIAQVQISLMDPSQKGINITMEVKRASNTPSDDEYLVTDTQLLLNIMPPVCIQHARDANLSGYDLKEFDVFKVDGGAKVKMEPKLVGNRLFACLFQETSTCVGRIDRTYEIKEPVSNVAYPEDALIQIETIKPGTLSTDKKNSGIKYHLKTYKKLVTTKEVYVGDGKEYSVINDIPKLEIESFINNARKPKSDEKN